MYLSPSPTTPPGTNLAGSRHKLPRVTMQPVPSRCHGPWTLIPSLPKLQGPSWHTKGSIGLLHAVVWARRDAGAWQQPGLAWVLVVLLQSRQGQLAVPVLGQAKEWKVKNPFVVSLCCFPE